MSQCSSEFSTLRDHWIPMPATGCLTPPTGKVKTVIPNGPWFLLASPGSLHRYRAWDLDGSGQPGDLDLARLRAAGTDCFVLGRSFDGLRSKGRAAPGHGTRP